jgi:ERF superfamily
MPRSSESVAALASALAKAQAELVNPEKSLTATIRPAWPGERERSFRYAPLASGLDIVRSTLGRHEIATVQTTAIDPAAGMVNLTTMLAHASGEWIASDWPVCPVAELVNPQRMGAALTYARRYALFTLVGIAGEDDLDAPNLCDAPAPSPSSSVVDRVVRPRDDRSRVPPRPPGNGHGGPIKGRALVILAAEQSAVVRDRLVAEIVGIQSADLAASWARQALPAKNTLTASDAKHVEDAFTQRLSEFTPSDRAGHSTDSAPITPVATPDPQTSSTSNSLASDRAADGVDKSTLAIAAPRRYRDRDHLRYVAKQACLVCGRKPSDPHHLRYLQPRALGRKASDEFTVPLCRIHHRLVHRVGNEAAWWKDAGIDPIKAARKLWKNSRIASGRIEPDQTSEGAASVPSSEPGGQAADSQQQA